MGPIKEYDVQPIVYGNVPYLRSSIVFCHVFVNGGNKICGKMAKWRGMYHGNDELYYASVFSDQESCGAVLLEVCEEHAKQLWPERIKQWSK